MKGYRSIVFAIIYAILLYYGILYLNPTSIICYLRNCSRMEADPLVSTKVVGRASMFDDVILS